jgi:hypothetical protein
MREIFFTLWANSARKLLIFQEGNLRFMREPTAARRIRQTGHTTGYQIEPEIAGEWTQFASGNFRLPL